MDTQASHGFQTLRCGGCGCACGLLDPCRPGQTQSRRSGRPGFWRRSDAGGWGWGAWCACSQGRSGLQGTRCWCRRSRRTGLRRRGAAGGGRRSSRRWPLILPDVTISTMLPAVMGGIIGAVMEPPVASPLRRTAVALAVLTACLCMGGCLSHASRRGALRQVRDDGPPNRRLAIHPERRVTQAGSEERRRASRPWQSSW